MNLTIYSLNRNEEKIVCKRFKNMFGKGELNKDKLNNAR